MKQHIEQYFESDFIGRQETTIRAHRRWLGLFLEHVGKKIDAQSYSSWVRHAFATWGDRTARNFAIAAAARFLAWGERQRLIEKSPHRLVRLPEPQQHDPREPFTEAEYLKLMAVADLSDPDLGWAIRLGWECGTAMADACLLQWSAIDFADRVIKLRRRKTGEPCLIPLAPDGKVLAGLWNLSTLPRSDYWPNRPPEVIYVMPQLAANYIVALKSGGATLQTRFRKVRDLAGVDPKKSFHNLRASFCSALANGGMNLAAACRLSGHRDPRIFQQYVTGDVEQLREQMMRARA